MYFCNESLNPLNHAIKLSVIKCFVHLVDCQAEVEEAYVSGTLPCDCKDACTYVKLIHTVRKYMYFDNCLIDLCDTQNPFLEIRLKYYLLYFVTFLRL